MPANKFIQEAEMAAERIGTYIPPTPLESAPILKEELGMELLLKREDLTEVHSFKVRGALNAILKLPENVLEQGVLAASAGNHAQGVAFAAREVGTKATIVMPRTTPMIKVDAVKRLGGHVILEGDSYSDAYEASQRLLSGTNMSFVHPFDDPDVIAGQATVAHEIARDTTAVSHVFVPVGGGGLIAGIASYFKNRNDTQHIRIVGVEPEDSDAMKLSLEAGYPVTLDHVGIFADGVAVKQVGDLTFNMAKQYVDEVITVDNDAISAAIEAFYNETRSILEPAGALAIAGIAQYSDFAKTVGDILPVAICSGANMSFSRLQAIVERSEIGRHKQGQFIIDLPERAGALLELCRDVINGHSITEFRYRLTDPNKARFMVGIEIRNQDDLENFKTKLTDNGYNFDDISTSSFAEYGKYLLGTACHDTTRGEEAFYELEFPERPGALTEFLTHAGQRWNISLFQYRNNGGDRGKVLIGFQAPHTQSLETVLATHTKWHTPVPEAEIDRFSQ